MSILRLLPDDSSVQGENYFVAAEKRIAGNPRQTAWVHYTDASGHFSAGYWRSEPGKWYVSYSEQEYCEILEGMSILTGSSGESITLRAGDRFIVPSGFTGTWEVVATTRKLFVISEPPA